MKRANNFLRFTFQLLLLAVIAFVLISVINSLGVNRPPALQVIQQVTNSAYPLPKQVLDSPYPPPVKASETITISLLTKGPPLFTPVPTLTLKPGPSPTLIPLLDPAKNPSGSLFFVAKTRNSILVNPQLMSVDAVGKTTNGQVKLSEDNLQSDSLVFPSPNGDRLAIFGGWGTLKLFNIANGNFEQVTETFANIGRFYNWFPDSRQILYGSYSLSLGDPISGEHIPLAVPGYGGITGAAASPDGKFVVYSYSTDIVNTHGLWIINSDGQNAHLLAKVPATITNISWSPDGKRIAFHGKGWQVVNSDGSNLRELANGIFVPQCYFLPPL